MFENTPSDRVQLVGLGELLSPANCMICRNGTCEEGYVNLDVWYDFEGQQYLCKTCVIQIAELFGCLTPEEAQHLQKQASELATENAKLWEEVKDARPILESISRLMLSGNVIDGSLAPSDGESESSSGTESTLSVTSGADEGEPEPSESVKGSDDNGISEPATPDRRKPTIQL